MSAGLPNYFTISSDCERVTATNNHYHKVSSSPPERISPSPLEHSDQRVASLTASSVATSSSSNSPSKTMLSTTPTSTDSRSYSHYNSPNISPQPKKTWERHYKSFLKRVGHNNSQKDEQHEGNSNNVLGTLIPPKFISTKSMGSVDVMKTDKHDTPNSFISPPNLTSTISMGSVNVRNPSRTYDELDEAMHNNRQRIKQRFRPVSSSSFSHDKHDSRDWCAMTDSMSRLSMKSQMMQADTVHSASEVNASTSDTTVRGGSLFKSVFKKKHKQSEPNNNNDGNQLDASSNYRRKTKSYDSLDTTKRNGLDVSNAHRLSSDYRSDIRRIHSSRTGSLHNPTRAEYPKANSSTSNDESTIPGRARLNSAPVNDSLLITPRSLNQNHNNNTHSQPSPTTSTQIKKVFTEFHNSKQFGKDTTSPYLGDETSVHRSQMFALYNALEQNRGAGSIYGISCPTRFNGMRQRSLDAIMLGNGSVPLAPVCEDVALTPLRVLLPFEGLETWTKDKMYLVAPAVLKMCPLYVLKLFTADGDGNRKKRKKQKSASGLSCLLNPENESSSENDESVPCFNAQNSCAEESSNTTPSLFGKITLGKAMVAILGTQKFTDETYGWLSGNFVIRQNYLLEYKEHDSLDSMPHGYAHLQYSTAQAHEEFYDLLQLQFYGNPCKREDPRVLLIRVGTKEERDRWVSSLNQASTLSIDDMYDCDSKLFGKGRYALVRPARRRKTPLQSLDTSSVRDDSYPEKNNRHNYSNDQKAGILKHSFSKSNEEFNYASESSLEKYDCALKIIDKVLFFDRVQQGKERVDSLVREAAVHATLASKSQSPSNFVRLQGIFETAQHIVLELELLDGTDLFHHVSEKEFLEETEAAIILKDLLVCLNDIQKIGIVHRDVKPANILMANRKKTGVSVKLADFGMATFVGVDELVRGRCGTPGYVAPEILAAGVNSGYGKNVDVFSAGVTLYILLCGYEPFYGENDAKLIKANREAIVEFPVDEWSSISLEGRDLIERMLKPNQRERISAADALKHPWITRRTSTSNNEEQYDKFYNEPHACSIS